MSTGRSLPSKSKEKKKKKKKQRLGGKKKRVKKSNVDKAQLQLYMGIFVLK